MGRREAEEGGSGVMGDVLSDPLLWAGAPLHGGALAVGTVPQTPHEHSHAHVGSSTPVRPHVRGHGFDGRSTAVSSAQGCCSCANR